MSLSEVNLAAISLQSVLNLAVVSVCSRCNLILTRARFDVNQSET